MVDGNRLEDRPVLRRTSFYHVQSHLLQPMIFELQNLGCAVRQIDNSPLHDRSPVVHFHHHRPSVVQVRHLHIASQGKRRMSCGHVVHVVVFAAGCGFAVEVLPIPGSCPNLIWFAIRGLLTDFRLDWPSWRGTGLRAVWSLSRPQSDDRKKDHQSMSYTSSHSVLLASQKSS